MLFSVLHLKNEPVKFISTLKKYHYRCRYRRQIMSNQLLSWLMFIVPWFSLLFMKKEDIKRYMPVALFAMLTSIIIYEFGITFKWWIVTEKAYPLQLMPFHIGLFPVLTMWVFKFTYKKLLLYLIVELVLNVGFDFGFLGYFLPARGILHFSTMTRLEAVGVTTAHGIILYIYQIWQEGVFIQPHSKTQNH
jgi:hypothetical protein